MAFSMMTPPKLMDYYEIAPGGDVTLVLHVPLEPLPTELDMVIDEGLGEEVEKVRTIRVRVFSQHLILASPVFKAMLQGPFSEAQALRTEGHTTISLPEDNAEAMILILNVIHHQNRSVTTFISRELMVQICILVDKYTFDQCLHFVSKEWIKNLRLSDKVPSSFCPALMEWILIAWVFDLNDIFINATSIAMSTATRPIDESDVMGLPIPSSIIDRMNMRREAAIRCHYANFCRFLDRYQETRHHGPSQEAKTLCQHKNEICDFYYLGCLFRHAILQKAYPPPEPPYTGQSQENIRAELCTNIWEESSGGFHQECGMETRKLLLEEIGNAPTALSIRDFKRGSFGFLGFRKLSRS